MKLPKKLQSIDDIKKFTQSQNKYFDIPIFATPILVAKFQKHEEYAQKFKNFDRVHRAPDNWKSSLNTSFPETSSDDPYIDIELSNSLKRDLMLEVKGIMSEYKLPTNLYMDAFWYNAYYEGQGQESHNHLSPRHSGAVSPFWSCVYFAKNVFPGSFMFNKTDLSLRSQQDVPYLNSKLGRYYSEIDFVDAYTQDGYILLFPPHVNHTVYVGELNKEDMRLTFSFNIMCNDSLNRYQIMEKKKEIENLKIVNSKAIGFKNK